MPQGRATWASLRSSPRSSPSHPSHTGIVFRRRFGYDEGMDSAATSPLLASTVPGPARFSGSKALVWLPLCAVQGLAVAWAAVLAQQYYAPLVLFPLLVGVCLGASSVGLMRLLQLGHRSTILAGLGLAFVLVVVGQHYLRYRLDLAQTRSDAATFQKAQALFPDLAAGSAPVPPGSFGEYLRWQAARGRPLHLGGYIARDGVAWFSWGVDAVLVLLAAVAVMRPAWRQPYCSDCRSWYRTIRSGRLSTAAGQRLALLAEIALLSPPPWVRYRLSDCNSGCGPARLMLFWEDSQGNQAAAETWLTAEGRRRVTALLDRARREAPDQSNHTEGSGIPSQETPEP